jgi:branched-chain amino acid transport system ATP-binding protein
VAVVATAYGDKTPEVAATPVLSIRLVGKRFGGLTALKDVSLDVAGGEVCGLIGPNGAGKTTLFDIVIDGRDVTHQLPERRARSGVRRTFQRVQLYGRLSVEDNVLTAMEWHGGGGGLLADLVAAPGRRRREAERRRQATDILEACGLSDLRGAMAGSLPIGQARLVELARAIADHPRLLLLDEPTSGLSAQEAGRFGEQIQRLKQEGVAIVLVEHDVGFVMGQCDRVVVLNLGTILAEGTPDQIQSHVEVREAYLG